MSGASGNRRRRLTALSIVFVATAVIVPLEATLFWLQSSPWAARQPITSRLSRGLYRYFAPMPHLDEDCVEFDPALLYRLRPGVCSYDAAEFQTTISANSLGLRDSEDALNAPDAVVLGDSYSMGWGVEEPETFAALLEQRLGVKILNTATPSYGTARQLEVMRRVDRSNLDLIILQYCSNDRRENRQYVDHGFELPTRTQADFDERISAYRRQRSYYPGKWTIFASSQALAAAHRALTSLPPESGDPSSDSDARLLRQILDQRSDLLGEARVVIFGLSDPARPIPEFAEALRHELAENNRDRHWKPFVVDVEARLKPSDYFDLDPHLNAAGNRTVADALEPFCGSSQALHARGGQDGVTSPGQSQ